MPTRRHLLACLSAAGLPALSPSVLAQQPSGTAALPTRVIPSTSERLPVIGMGSADSLDVGPSEAERAPLREIFRRFFAAGAVLIDTAPSYRRSEAVIGDLLAESGGHKRAFLATKIGATGREAGLAQFQRSLAALRTDHVELLQVHNLIDWRTQFALALSLRDQGRVRYTGLTHYADWAHGELAAAMRAVRPDFVQINYSVGDRSAESTVFPVARELGIAVIVNRPFEDGRLFQRVAGRPLPGWAADVGASAWSQLFLKFILSNPTVTAVIPATSRPDRASENLAAGLGPLLSAAQRQELATLLG